MSEKRGAFRLPVKTRDDDVPKALDVTLIHHRSPLPVETHSGWYVSRPDFSWYFFRTWKFAKNQGAGIAEHLGSATTAALVDDPVGPPFLAARIPTFGALHGAVEHAVGHVEDDDSEGGVAYDPGGTRVRPVIDSDG